MAFLVLMVNLFLSIKHIFLLGKRLLSLPIFLLFILISNNTQAQDLLYGFTAGLNMNTISSKEESGGLKLGCNVGGIVQLQLDEVKSISANIKFSTKGQQYSRIIQNQNTSVKIYNSTTLYYIDIPVVFQYYFKDLIGFEAGPSFNICLGGKNKSKISNEDWFEQKFKKSTYNPFEFGLTFGFFSRDLGQSSFNNIYIEFKYFVGLTNFIKDYEANRNTGVFLNIGYIIERPMKKLSSTKK